MGLFMGPDFARNGSARCFLARAGRMVGCLDQAEQFLGSFAAQYVLLSFAVKPRFVTVPLRHRFLLESETAQNQDRIKSWALHETSTSWLNDRGSSIARLGLDPASAGIAYELANGFAF
jgi:hypothetical protein